MGTIDPVSFLSNILLLLVLNVFRLISNAFNHRECSPNTAHCPDECFAVARWKLRSPGFRSSNIFMKIYSRPFLSYSKVRAAECPCPVHILRGGFPGEYYGAPQIRPLIYTGRNYFRDYGHACFRFFRTGRNWSGNLARFTSRPRREE